MEGHVPTREELERLSSQELHNLAMKRALKHLDVKFLWNLVEMVPAAELAAGEERNAEQDAFHASTQIADALNADGDGRLAEALRPVYIDYLASHPDD
jgi:hypothetical protein